MIKNKGSFSQFYLIIVLTIVILLGIFFRVNNIDKKVYWHDEVYTSLRVAGYKGDDIVKTFSHGEVITAKDLLEFQNLKPNTPLSKTINSLIEHPEHPPLYYLLLRFWQNLFGSSIFINRSLSVLFSLLVFPLIYYLSQQLFNSHLVSLISVAFVAISPIQILYAQEAREYSLWMLTIILVSLFFFKAIKSNKYSYWIFYSLSLTLTFYTSVLSIFLPFVNMIYIYLMRKSLGIKTKVNFIIFTIISGILFLPWIFITLINFHILKEKTYWINTEESLSFLANLWGLHLTSLFADIGFPLYHWASYIFIVLVCSLIFYSLFFVIKNTSKNIWLYLLLLIVIPTLSLILPDLIFGGVRSSMTRYFFPVYLSVYLNIAYTLGKKIEQKFNFWLIILGLLLTVSIISNIISGYSDTWWNKGSSYYNPAMAKIINEVENPLVITQIVNGNDTNKGNIISISHRLKPETKLQLLLNDNPLMIDEDFKNIYIFNPSPELTQNIEKNYQKKVIKVYDLLYKINSN